MLSFFPRDVLDEIWDLIESVSEGRPTCFSLSFTVTGWKAFIRVLNFPILHFNSVTASLSIVIFLFIHLL